MYSPHKRIYSDFIRHPLFLRRTFSSGRPEGLVASELRSVFLSLWELLILAEPWLMQETPRFRDNCPPPDIPDVSAVRAFACSQNLSDFYIHTYQGF